MTRRLDDTLEDCQGLKASPRVPGRRALAIAAAVLACGVIGYFGYRLWQGEPLRGRDAGVVLGAVLAILLVGAVARFQAVLVGRRRG